MDVDDDDDGPTPFPRMMAIPVVVWIFHSLAFLALFFRAVFRNPPDWDVCIFELILLGLSISFLGAGIGITLGYRFLFHLVAALVFMFSFLSLSLGSLLFFMHGLETSTIVVISESVVLTVCTVINCIYQDQWVVWSRNRTL